MNKLITLIMTILMVILINFNYKSYCIDYYDLYFQKENENIIVSEYEDVNYNKKHYKTIVNTTISKDEEDAISYIIGRHWIDNKLINKEVNKNNIKYTKQCIVYKEIKGKLIKSYENWYKEKEIIIKIPIIIEYK